LLTDLYRQVLRQSSSTSNSKPLSPSMGDTRVYPLMTMSLTSNKPSQRCLDSNPYLFTSQILIDPPDIWTPMWNSTPQPQHGSLRGAPHPYHQPSLPPDATHQTLTAQSTATTRSFLNQDTTTTSMTMETYSLNSPEPYHCPYVRRNKPSQPQVLTCHKPTHIHLDLRVSPKKTPLPL
jgi:hypothetical protein